MKPVNREINIFNLSMMDVISGAMGAFLILVLFLARHYNEQTIDTRRIMEMQKELVEATGNLSDISQMITGNTSNQELIEKSLQAARSNVERSKAHIKQIKDQLDAASARINQLKEENTSLSNDLESWKTFFVMTKWQCDQISNVDIYLWNDNKAKAKQGEQPRQMEPFDPRKWQGRFFSSDLYGGLHNANFGIEIWSSGQSMIGENLKLYYRLEHKTADLPTCTVSSWLNNHQTSTKIETVTLDASQPWAFVGYLHINDERNIEYSPATEQQRSEEHAAIRKRIGD